MVFDASDGLKAKGGTGNQPDQDVSAAWNVKMKERNSDPSREGFPHRHTRNDQILLNFGRFWQFWQFLKKFKNNSS